MQDTCAPVLVVPFDLYYIMPHHMHDPETRISSPEIKSHFIYTETLNSNSNFELRTRNSRNRVRNFPNSRRIIRSRLPQASSALPRHARRRHYYGVSSTLVVALTTVIRTAVPHRPVLAPAMSTPRETYPVFWLLLLQ